MTKLSKLKKDFPYDMLGRSLAANAHYPQDLYKKLKLKELSSFQKLNLKELEKSLFPQDVALCSKDLEELSLCKRYAKNLLIYTKEVEDEHELLLALVFGADAVLVRDLKLYTLGLHFGLSPILKLDESMELESNMLVFCNDASLIARLDESCVVISSKEIKGSFYTKELR